GLLDRLSIGKAQVVGASMGGMVVRIVAGQYRQRVRSLVSVMSSSGDPKLPQAKPEAMSAITQPRPPGGDRELAVQHGMKIYRAIGSPGFHMSEEELRANVDAAFERSYYPLAGRRRAAAILANGTRVDEFERIAWPQL